MDADTIACSYSTAVFISPVQPCRSHRHYAICVFTGTTCLRKDKLAAFSVTVQSNTWRWLCIAIKFGKYFMSQQDMVDRRGGT